MGELMIMMIIMMMVDLGGRNYEDANDDTYKQIKSKKIYRGQRNLAGA
jgi:hypothetical protein